MKARMKAPMSRPIILSILLSLVASTAVAEGNGDGKPADDEAADEAATTEEGDASATPGADADKQPAKKVAAVGDPSVAADTSEVPANAFGVIERMPPSAFPEPVIRGIPDGSLRTTFHGLQWPYFPKTGIGISGYTWVDSGYETIKRGNPSEQGIDYWLQQGRVLVRLTPTYSKGDFFVQGQAELVVNKDQSLRQPDIADTDDLWLKVGQWNKWDLQLGRYEGWEVYHLGMGLDLNTLERQGAVDERFSVPGIYGVTYAYYRPASVGQAALHYYPTDKIRFELGTQFGNEFGSNALAVRPVGVLDLGWLKVKAGAEYKKLTDQHDEAKGETMSRGSGASIQFVYSPWFEAGINGAYGLVDRVAQDGNIDFKGSNDTWSVGAFANARVIEDLVVGAGYNYTYLEDLHMDSSLGRNQKFNHNQAFAAVQYLVAKQLFIKLVGAWARADFAPNFDEPVFQNRMLSARLRMLYLF